MSCVTTAAVRHHVVRFKPGDEAVGAIARYVIEHGIRAGYIAAAVGSLSEVTLRYAGRPEPQPLSGKFEVIALNGTLDPDGSGHLHLSLSDEQGSMVGGHLLSDAIVRTTLELVIAELPELEFSREDCALSGYPELVSRNR